MDDLLVLLAELKDYKEKRDLKFKSVANIDEILNDYNLDSLIEELEETENYDMGIEAGRQEIIDEIEEAKEQLSEALTTLEGLEV